MPSASARITRALHHGARRIEPHEALAAARDELKPELELHLLELLGEPRLGRAEGGARRG
jgi:hypothetical protein